MIFCSFSLFFWTKPSTNKKSTVPCSSKGPPLPRSQHTAQAKGTGGKGRGKGGHGEGKGGKKGAHPGRGEYSRYAGYSEAASGAAPSVHFQESVPKGQAKGAPPEEPPSTTGDANESGRTARATTEFIPTAISQLSPAEIEEERRIAEAFNAFLNAFPAPPPQPAAPRPAPATTWTPQLPTATPSGSSAETLASEPPGQGAADVSAEAAEPGADLAPPADAEGEPPTIGSYPPLRQPSALTVIGRSPPPPPPPTALVGRHVTVHGSELPGIEGESGHVTEYGPFSEQYNVQLNNGHKYHLAPRHLRLTQALAKAVQLPPMQKHPLPATVTPKYRPPPVCFDRPKPAADQPELGPHPPAPRPATSKFEEPPPPPPGPVPTEPSVKQGPPPKTPPPRIPRSEPPAQVQRPIQKSLGKQKASAPRPPPARRTTLHYSLDPAHPGPIAKPAAVDPWMLPAAARDSEGLAPAKPALPPAIVKPCAYQDYRKTTPTAEPKAATPPGHPKGAADRSGPRRAGPADTQPPTRRWVPSKESPRLPAPPIPKSATGKAAPASDPKASPEPPATAPTTEAGPEPSDSGGTQTAEPGDSQGFEENLWGARALRWV